MALVNDPVPVPSLVHAPPTVGFSRIAVQTPRAVTGLPPSAVTWPPPLAVAGVREAGRVVVTVGVV
jgi:hypothetical protein